MRASQPGDHPTVLMSTSISPCQDKVAIALAWNDPLKPSHVMSQHAMSHHARVGALCTRSQGQGHTRKLERARAPPSRAPLSRGGPGVAPGVRGLPRLH